MSRRALAASIMALAVFCGGIRASAGAWTFMVYGDTRALEPTADFNEEIVAELVAETVRLQPDFVVVPGDLVFNGSAAAFAAWRGAMSPVYDAGIGVYPQVGNHDLPDMPSWAEILGPEIPDNGPPGQVDGTYFVQRHNALLISFDQFAAPGFFDSEWLATVLATNTATHVFAAGHMPAFKVVHDDTLDDIPARRDLFWQTLVDAGVRAYFCGHDHFYDHLRADNGDGNPENDMHQLIVGTGGATLYGDGFYDGLNDPWNPQRVYHDNSYGYVLVEIDELKSTLTWHRRVEPGVYQASEDRWSYTASHQPRLRIEGGPGAAISFTARAGMKYILEQSSDMLNWSPLQTNTGPGEIRWSIPMTQNPCALFRVRQR